MTTISADVNLTWLAPGRVGGSEEYLCRQLAGLFAAGAAEDLTVRLFCQPSFPLAHPEFNGRADMVTLPIDRDIRIVRIAAENSWLARHTRGADVVHHGGGTAPVIGRRAILLTVHDLQYLQFPQYFSRARREYLTRCMPGSVRRATLVGVPSEFVRGTVIDAFGLDSDRVTVIPHGVPRLERPGDAAIAAVRTRYGVSGDYVVYPAITHPHKGHTTLVELLAATATPAHSLSGLGLVVVGAKGSAENTFRAAVDAAGVSARVVRTGRIPAAHRDALVAGARALIFPSEYEGFGAPLVEAMDLGVPVVASDHPAVVEVCGGAAVVVATRSGDAWAEAVVTALQRADELVAAGHARREAFTLERSGVALVAAYRSVATGGPT
jgi:glycosyltransferase involved in cell wall biosynthesis